VTTNLPSSSRPFTSSITARSTALWSPTGIFLLSFSLWLYTDPTYRIRPDLRDLPSLVPDEWRNTTGEVVEAELGARIAKARRMIEAGLYDSSNEESQNGLSSRCVCILSVTYVLVEEIPETTCPFALYAQIEPAYNVPAAVMREVENENEVPTGLAPVLPEPPMRLRGVLLSPECGLLYTVEHTDGLSRKQWYRKVTNCKYL
jgi:transmembrane E3 ubiquitin-protein ligase